MLYLLLVFAGDQIVHVQNGQFLVLVGGLRTLARMVCELVSSFRQCQKTDGINRVRKVPHGACWTGGQKLFGQSPYTRTTFQKEASLRRVPGERVSPSNLATYVYLDFVFVFGICEGPSWNNSGERVPPSNSATLSRTNLEVGAAATPHFSNQLPHHLECDLDRYLDDMV